MPPTLTGGIAWPLIMFMAVILVARYRWFSDNPYNIYLNNALAFGFLGQLLREQLVQNTLSRTTFMSIDKDIPIRRDRDGQLARKSEDVSV